MQANVYVNLFVQDDQSYASAGEILDILGDYGDLHINEGEGYARFTPKGNDICDNGYLTFSDDGNASTVSFEHPVAKGRFANLVYDLLALGGLVFFEQNQSYWLARVDCVPPMPEGLKALCASGKYTVVSSVQDVAAKFE